MKLIIVGGGETGRTVANLLRQDYDVTVVEKDKTIASQLANSMEALIINGDATDITVLKEAGVESADAVIVTTSDDTVNLMICQIAKSENVKKIIPVVKSPKNEELFTKLGITSLVSVAGTNASGIKRMLESYGDSRIIAQFGDGDVQLIQQVVDKKSVLKDKPAILKKAVIATIYRKGDIIIPKSTTNIEEGDVILVAVKTKDLSSVVDLIKGQ